MPSAFKRAFPVCKSIEARGTQPVLASWPLSHIWSHSSCSVPWFTNLSVLHPSSGAASAARYFGNCFWTPFLSSIFGLHSFSLIFVSNLLGLVTGCISIDKLKQLPPSFLAWVLNNSCKNLSLLLRIMLLPCANEVGVSSLKIRALKSQSQTFFFLQDLWQHRTPYRTFAYTPHLSSLLAFSGWVKFPDGLDFFFLTIPPVRQWQHKLRVSSDWKAPHSM